MICTLCGKPQPCVHTLSSHTQTPEVSANVNVDAGFRASSLAGETGKKPPMLEDLAAEVQSRADQRTWREEVSLRVKGHRARHRRGDTASLELDFPAQEEDPPIAAPSLARLRSSLASSTRDALSPPPEISVAQELSIRSAVQVASDLAQDTIARRRPRKIIRFPKYPSVDTTPPTPMITEMELAEPVAEAPRILDAPPAEQMELLPSFADLHLDETPRGTSASGYLDLPLRPAELGRRAVSALIDGGIVSMGVGLFSVAFIKLAESTPPFRLQMATLLTTGVVLWLVFEYLFLVYGRQTPGMRAAQLELFAFQGERAPVAARRTRALAMGLSAISVGLGFAWALIDEDTLGWHDKISQTYLKGEQQSVSAASRDFWPNNHSR